MAATAENKRRKGRFKAFFKGVLSELKKVHWPSKKQLATYTLVVCLTCLAVALVISAFDWIVSTVVELILGLA